MKALRAILFITLGLFLLYVKLASVGPSTGSHPSYQAPTGTSVSDDTVPAKVTRVLQIIRSTGAAPEGYVGGRVFQNREGRLPSDGDYREFDVDPHNGPRNAERIIVEWNTKKAWYTADHYQTFIPLP